MSSSTTLGIKVEKAVRDRLKKLGKLKDRSPHWLAKQAVEEYLEREENWEREKQEDHRRWARYLDTGESYSRAQVSGWMKRLRDGKRERWPR
jgi:predicted transcriptional regulator